jgi:hypothetical protein
MRVSVAFGLPEDTYSSYLTLNRTFEKASFILYLQDDDSLAYLVVRGKYYEPHLFDHGIASLAEVQ